MAACLAAVEAEEALLQIYALQWRAIDLRAQQLRAECRRVALDEEIDREERELLREHEQLLRIREKQLAQEKFEDAFALRAEVRKLRRQSDALQQRQVAQAEAAVVATASAANAEPAKRKMKAKAKAALATQQSDATAKTAAAGVKKSVAFSPRKPPTAAPSARPRRLEESFDEELEAEAGASRRVAATKTAADELMQMLAQDKGSESEGDEVSLSSLLPAFSPGGRSPSRAESATGTPSKFTPSKLARSVVKKAMAAPMEFDFTRKAALAKAKAAKEKHQTAEDGSSDDDAPTDAETPSKKALKRRKDLGISFAAKPVTTSKAAAVATVVSASSAAQNSGAKSLMQMIGVASLSVKPKETSSAFAAKKQPAELAKSNPRKDKVAKEKTASNAVEPEGEDFVELPTLNITKRAKPKKPATENASTTTSTTEGEAAAADKTSTKPKPLAKKKDKMDAVEQAIAKASLLTRMPSIQDIETPKVAGKKTKMVLKKPAVTSLAAKRAEFQKILSDGMAGTAAAIANGSDADDAEPEPDAFATPQKPRTLKRKRAEDVSAPAQAPPPPQTSYLQSPSVAALLAMRPSKSPIGIRYVPKTLKTPQMVRKRPRSGQQEGSGHVDDAAPAIVAPQTRATTRPQRQVPVAAAARGGFNSVAGALATAGGSSGPSFFDKFVNDGGLRLKRTAKP